MSCSSANNFIHRKDNPEREDEDKIISRYILDLKNEETRDEAMKKLNSYQDQIMDRITLYLWYSRGTMTVLLQELIKLYQYLPPFDPKKITDEAYNKTVQILYFFQHLASNDRTKKQFIESGILVYVFPFLSISPNTTKSYKIRISVLNLIKILSDEFNLEIFNILKQYEIVPTLLKIIVKGKEIDKKLTSCIILKLISNLSGLEYVCEVKERLKAVVLSFGKMLINDELKFKKIALKILLTILENNEAKNIVKKDLLNLFGNYNFYQHLDENSKTKAKQLEEILKDKELGFEPNNNDSKIQKLKNDLTNNSNINISINNNYKNKKNETNNIHNLNLNKSSSYNSFNNGSQKQININSSDYNNKLNLNMMFINNINQMKMTNGFMMPQVGDYTLNKDNESYMNPNIYNQNGNNGYGNMNYFNSYKNM